MIDEGVLAPYQIYQDDKMDAMVYSLWGKDFFKEAKIMYQERAKNEPMKVTYKPHTDCGKKEPEIPEGWELAIGQPVASLEGMLMPKDGRWVPAVWGIAEHGKTIRPKPAPLRVIEAGWYATTRGDWIKVTEERLKKHPTFMRDSLIARATAAQAAPLDAL